MNLHRATRSDWSDIPPQERSFWQRLAASSHGVLTPANFVSLIGALLMVRGLLFLRDDQLIRGTVLVLVGRFADILDGIVADYTKTKSPLGEAIDATVDKILLILALYVLLDKSLIPLVVGAFMAVHAVYNIAVSTIARQLKARLHPSRAGKLSAAIEWMSVGFYLLVDILKQHHHNPNLAHAIALVSFILFVVSGTWSSINYTRHVYYKQAMRP